MKTRNQMAYEESTRNPIFCYQLKRRDGWETERVFLSREEAETYGENNQHNVRRGKDVGWRVYCVPAEGLLADALKAIETQMVTP